ncbi:hypothetical protein SAMN05421754_101545 [Nitrosomonas sp. Nm58]|nr:hypothetical protein SAMN05421754_101545 [Nitrosomonas sp. Nm58]
MLYGLGRLILNKKSTLRKNDSWLMVMFTSTASEDGYGLGYFHSLFIVGFFAIICYSFVSCYNS